METYFYISKLGKKLTEQEIDYQDYQEFRKIGRNPH